MKVFLPAVRHNETHDEQLRWYILDHPWLAPKTKTQKQARVEAIQFAYRELTEWDCRNSDAVIPGFGGVITLYRDDNFPVTFYYRDEKASLTP